MYLLPEMIFSFLSCSVATFHEIPAINLRWCFGFEGATLVSSDDDDLDLDLPTVNSNPLSKIAGLDNLPFNSSSLPSPDEVERAFREKCVMNGGEEAYTNATVWSVSFKNFWALKYNLLFHSHFTLFSECTCRSWSMCSRSHWFQWAYCGNGKSQANRRFGWSVQKILQVMAVSFLFTEFLVSSL